MIQVILAISLILGIGVFTAYIFGKVIEKVYFD